MTQRFAKLSVALAIVALAACGGDDDGVTPAPDSGAPPADAGTTSDGSMPEEDASMPPIDGGDGEMDAGTELDGGETTPDAGEMLDAGEDMPDAAVMCPEGATGPTCEECLPGYERVSGACVLDLPPATNLNLWLDADVADSFTLSGTAVVSWRDRRPGVMTELTQGTSSARPGHVPSARAGRAGVRFDGGDQLFVNSYFGLSTADYEIIVVAHPLSAGTPSGLVSTASGTTSWAVMLDQHTMNDYRLTHRAPAAASGGHTVVADRREVLEAGWVAASHQSSGTIDTMSIWASDRAGEEMSVLVVTPSSGATDPLTLRIGRTATGFLVGDIYEVLIYTRRLTVAERAEVTAYLRAKWNL